MAEWLRYSRDLPFFRTVKFLTLRKGGRLHPNPWMEAPFYLFIHKDYPIDTEGVNSGAETATVWLARTLAALGKTVVVAAQLKSPECRKWGVEFWDLGVGYDVAGRFHGPLRRGHTGYSLRVVHGPLSWASLIHAVYRHT